VVPDRRQYGKSHIRGRVPDRAFDQPGNVVAVERYFDRDLRLRRMSGCIAPLSALPKGSARRVSPASPVASDCDIRVSIGRADAADWLDHGGTGEIILSARSEEPTDIREEDSHDTNRHGRIPL
jgi:hypothetical protein